MVSAAAASAEAQAPPTAVVTFQSIGLSWSPGIPAKQCTVSYRAAGSPTWLKAQPLWYDARNGEYRGSIVRLASGTTYAVQLSLTEPGGTTALATAGVQATTWSETFNVVETVRLPVSRSTTYVIDRGGPSPSQYVLYTGPATIDVAGASDHCVDIRASNVILRGVTLRNAARHGVRLHGVKNVVVEDSDISGWGRIEADGWGARNDGGIYSNDRTVQRVVIQRNRIHHPRSDSNHWDEPRPSYANNPHPVGPQAISFGRTTGNHVIRYNEVYSDIGHMFADAIGGYGNFSEDGFPNRDSDIHGNIVSHAWDDGIEAEGANRNVRVYENYVDQTYVKIAAAGTSIGPLYVFRNVAARSSRTDAPSTDLSGRGGFLKTATHATYSGGRIYVLHNTLLQAPPVAGSTLPLGCNTGLGFGGAMSNVVSRNNILHVVRSGGRSINDRVGDPEGDYDYDLYSGVVVGLSGAEANGRKGVPVYVAGNGPASGLGGLYQLAATSPGFDRGIRLENINDGFAGGAPDAGAHEAGWPRLEFGVGAYRNLVGVTAALRFASEPAVAGQFRIIRSGSTALPLDVSFAISGTARNGVDYQRIEGRATILPKMTWAAVTVTPLGDTSVEGSETVIPDDDP
jgi:hypothetical protein